MTSAQIIKQVGYRGTCSQANETQNRLLVPDRELTWSPIQIKIQESRTLRDYLEKTSSFPTYGTSLLNNKRKIDKFSADRTTISLRKSNWLILYNFSN